MKKILKIIAVILVCVLTLPLTYTAGYLIGTQQNKNNEKTRYKKAEAEINIMTLNICCWSFDGKDLETRADGIAKTISNYKPDSIGFQEATPYWMGELNKRLNNEYAYVGVGSNTALDYTESSDEKDEFTAIFYLKNKFKVVDFGYFWLSETPDTPSYGWNSAYIRICTWVILENKHTKTKYVHINTHFDNESSEARRNSIGMILEKAKEFKDLPVVFTGDLNFIEKSLGYKDITGDCLKDTKVLAKDTMSSATFHAGDPETYKDFVLDYILINDKFNAVKYKVIKDKYKQRYISDHYAVVASVIVC